MGSERAAGATIGPGPGAKMGSESTSGLKTSSGPGANIGSRTAAKTDPTESGAGAPSCPWTPSGAPLVRIENVERIINI